LHGFDCDVGRNSDRDVRSADPGDHHDHADTVAVRDRGVGIDEFAGDVDAVEHGEYGGDVHEHCDDGRFCGSDAGAVPEHCGGCEALHVPDYVHADGGGRAHRNDHVYRQRDGKPADRDADRDGRCGGDRDCADFVDVWQSGGGNDECGADGDGIEQRQFSVDIYQYRDVGRFCRRDAGAVPEHWRGKPAVRIFDHVQADGDGNADGSDHVHGYWDGKSADRDTDRNGNARNGDGDGDAEQLGVWLAGTDDNERAFKRDSDEHEHGPGEFHGLHG